MLEDDVIGVFADRLREDGAQVLAQGGNQCSAFRFSIGSAIKAPDLVARLGSILFISECKVRPRDLFKVGPRGFSDFSVMEFASANDAVQRTLISEAIDRISTFSLTPPTTLRVCTGVFAVGDFSPWRSTLEHSLVTSYVISFDPTSIVRFAGPPLQLFGAPGQQ